MSDLQPDPPRGAPDEPSRWGGVIGVVFVIGLAVGAIFLVNRMQHWATMGDCAFTKAPACRELLNR